MRTSELQTALQALDHLPMPDKTAALRRVNVYAKAGVAALDPPAYPLPTPRPPLLRRPALAAAVALSVIGVGAGSVAGVDLYRYNTASDFFADYRLSTDGISRRDLWEVYRDVVTGQFSLPATGQMLQSNAGLSPSDSLSAEEDTRPRRGHPPGRILLYPRHTPRPCERSLPKNRAPSRHRFLHPQPHGGGGDSKLCDRLFRYLFGTRDPGYPVQLFTG